jgi:phosphopantothenoylcysteine decarboxylase / phosphopantothenate---cysteine ligase
MSRYKILLGITGSIAAYKSAYLISKLVQNDCEVKVVATECALKFIGKATIEGLSGGQVFTDSFEDGKMMGHINLIKWADIVIVCPASANTINKMANGIADNLLTSLFLVNDFSKPYLIVPAMNTNMYEHPATKESLDKLKSWGIEILPTAEGRLACGDIGKGKLIEPDEIYERIILALSNKKTPKKKLKILITAGGTKQKIDGVRFITNMSTGKTAASIADYFLRRNHDVTFVHSCDSATPSNNCEKISFTDFANLHEEIEKKISAELFDVVIHNAAVSDYSVKEVEMDGKKNNTSKIDKIDSGNSEIILYLKRNEKIIDNLKTYSMNKNLKVVGFKFTNTDDVVEREEAVKKLLGHSGCDYVVLNDKNDRDDNNLQKSFSVFNCDNKIGKCISSYELAQKLEEVILSEL